MKHEGGSIHKPKGVSMHPLPGDTDGKGDGNTKVPSQTSGEMNAELRAKALKVPTDKPFKERDHTRE